MASPTADDVHVPSAIGKKKKFDDTDVPMSKKPAAKMKAKAKPFKKK